MGKKTHKKKDQSVKWEWMFTNNGWDLAEWLERLIANGKAATVRGSFSASSHRGESEGWQIKAVLNKVHTNKQSPCWMFTRKSERADFPSRQRAWRAKAFSTWPAGQSEEDSVYCTVYIVPVAAPSSPLFQTASSSLNSPSLQLSYSTFNVQCHSFRYF